MKTRSAPPRRVVVAGAAAALLASGCCLPPSTKSSSLADRQPVVSLAPAVHSKPRLADAGYRARPRKTPARPGVSDRDRAIDRLDLDYGRWGLGMGSRGD